MAFKTYQLKIADNTLKLKDFLTKEGCLLIFGSISN